MRLVSRVAISTMLLVTLGGLCVHYGTTYDDNWPHPTGDQFQKQGTETFIGDRVLLFGEVRAVDADAETITIHVTDDSDEIAAKLTVSGVEKRVEPGGVVQVYGVLESKTKIHADRAVVVNRDTSATTFKLGTSVIGLLLAVGYFLQHWRMDVRKLVFERRVTDTTHETDAERKSNPEGRRRG